MSDTVLDDPGFLVARERFWTTALTDDEARELLKQLGMPFRQQGV